MAKLKNYDIELLFEGNEDINRKDSFEIKELKEGEKISIVSDSMFRTLFLNSKRIKNSAKLLSYIIDYDYEEILANLKFTKNDLDKEIETNKNERCDFVAHLGESIINIEMNNNSKFEDLQRNQEYSHRLFSSKIEVGSKYKYNQVIQININNFSFKEYKNTIDYIYLMNQEGKVYTDSIIYVNIYLPNIRRKCYNEGIKSLSELEKFLLALSENDIEYSKEISEGDKFMEKLMEEAKKACLILDIHETYDHELANKRAYLEQGREAKEKEAAINFYKNGASKKLIIDSLGITEEKLEEYLKEITTKN